MKLENYKFGSLTIDGKIFTTDPLIVDDTIILENWWRKDGHSLHMKDFEEVIEYTPAILVIGRGHDDRLAISEEIRDKLKDAGFDLIDNRTAKAIQIFNDLQQMSLDQPLIGGFHLNC